MGNKIVTVLIPTFNEEENIPIIYDKIKNIFFNLEYSYRILFIDNCSNDSSREIISKICINDLNVLAIFNANNFGFVRSQFYGLTQSIGDCTILLDADMQTPPELIPTFLEKWEKGYQIVLGIKNKSKENKVMFFLRKIYYKLIKKISLIPHIEQFTGFGLYDKSFIEILKNLEDPLPYLRGIVGELGGRKAFVFYEQNLREHGKTNFNIIKLYDLAMLGITSYSKALLRFAIFLGFGFGVICFILSIVTFIMKILNWNRFPMGIAAISIGVFFLGAVQLFFIGLLGEYILNMNIRIMKRPLIIEEKRINFNENINFNR